MSVASGCSFSATVTATAQADLDKLSSCAAISGDVLVTGDDLQNANLDGVQEIKGSLLISDATNLNSFSAGSLTSVDNTLNLTRLTVATSLTFPVLTKVGSIQIVTLPALREFGFTDGISQVETVQISDTAVTTLTGINPVNVDTFNLNNNNYLQSVVSPLQTVSNALIVTDNGRNLAASFDSLIWVNNVTISKTSNLSFASLQAVNGSFGVNNNSFTTLNLSSVEKVGQTIAVFNNNELTSLDFSNVTTLAGDLTVANNTALEAIDGFKELEVVRGSITLTGDLANVTLPALDSVTGSFKVDSGNKDFDCDNIKEIKSFVQGAYLCKAVSKSDSQASGSGSGSGSSKASGSASTSKAKSSGAAAGISGYQSSTLLGAVAALVISFL